MAEETPADRIFDKAIELPISEREAYVKSQPVSDEIKAEVLQLLQYADEADNSGMGLDEIKEGTEKKPQLKRYEVGSFISDGGMGQVYVGMQKSPRRKVAIKVLHPSLAEVPKARERFKREAHLMGQLDDPNIVKIIEFVEENEKCYLVMEYIEGPTKDNSPVTLQRIVKHFGGRLSPRHTKAWMLKLTKALSYAHSKGVIHRDIKPRNVLIDRNSDVRLTDFGIAAAGRVEGTKLTTDGSIIGTYDYMSPEQRAGEAVIDERSDIYSLGKVLCLMLTGTLPEGFDEVPSQVRDDISPQWDDVVKKALQRRPSRRFRSMEEMRKAIAAIPLDVPTDVREPDDTPVEKPEAKEAESYTPNFTLGGGETASQKISSKMAAVAELREALEATETPEKKRDDTTRVAAETASSKAQTKTHEETKPTVQPKAFVWKSVLLLIGVALTVVVVSGIISARKSAAEFNSSRQMRSLALAVSNYESALQHYPPAFSRDEAGKPLLSWRVHILPFIDEGDLWEQFRLDEPWDSPHNLALVAKMPEVFQSPDSDLARSEGKTNYFGIIGDDIGVFTQQQKGSKTKGPRGIQTKDLQRGVSKTAMIVEVTDNLADVWTRPSDYNPYATAPFGELNARKRGVLVAYADGHTAPLSLDRKWDDVIQNEFLRTTESGPKTTQVPSTPNRSEKEAAESRTHGEDSHGEDSHGGISEAPPVAEWKTKRIQLPPGWKIFSDEYNDSGNRVLALDGKVDFSIDRFLVTIGDDTGKFDNAMMFTALIRAGLGLMAQEHDPNGTWIVTPKVHEKGNDKYSYGEMELKDGVICMHILVRDGIEITLAGGKPNDSLALIEAVSRSLGLKADLELEKILKSQPPSDDEDVDDLFGG